MNVFERGIQDVAFKRLSGGDWGFFPHGPWGRGVVIPAHVDRGRLRRALLRQAALGFSIMVVAGVAAGPLAWLACAAAHLVVVQLLLRRRTAAWPPSAERLSGPEVLSRQAAGASRGRLWAVGFGSAAGVALGAQLLALPAERPTGLLLLLASLLCGFHTALLCRCRRSLA